MRLKDTGELGQGLARAGFVGRALFYLLLAGLTVRITFDGQSRTQDNANGALALVAGSAMGKVAIGGVAIGFLSLGIMRFLAAVRDERAPRSKRVLTAMQGIGCLAVAGVPISFLFGDHQVGSEQAHETTTAHLLRLPAGQALVVVVGFGVLTVCAFQMHTALGQDFADGLDLRKAPRWVRSVVRASGSVGIGSRAAVLMPIGVLLVVAGVRGAPGKARGLDAEALELAQRAWGKAVLVLVALGLLTFAVYSALEAKYRDVTTSR